MVKSVKVCCECQRVMRNQVVACWLLCLLQSALLYRFLLNLYAICLKLKNVFSWDWYAISAEGKVVQVRRAQLYFRCLWLASAAGKVSGLVWV